MDPLVRLFLSAALLACAGPSWAAQAKVNTGSGQSGSLSGAMGAQDGGLGSGRSLNVPTLVNPLSTPLGALHTTPNVTALPQTALLPASVITGPSAQEAPTQAAPAPPGPPNDGGSASGGGGGGPPYFVGALIRLGVPSDLALRLHAHQLAKHPAKKDQVNDPLAHAQDAASLIARILDDDQVLTTPQRVMLLTAAVLGNTEPDGESKALLFELEGAYGFTTAQVQSLIKGRSGNGFSASSLAWAVRWAKVLSYADKTASYVGSLESAQRALGKKSPAVLKALNDDPHFALLPADLQANFAAVYAHVKKAGGSSPPKTKAGDSGVVDRAKDAAGALSDAAITAPSGPSKDALAVQRYIRSIMGSQKPTARQSEALLQDYMEQKNISPVSPRGRALRVELIPEIVAAERKTLAGLDPRFHDFSDVLLKLGADYGVTPMQIELLIKDKGLTGLLLSADKGLVERTLDHLLRRRQLESITSRYPGTEQGDLMREVVATMSARSGKSVEEIARDGVFLYADFAGSSPLRVAVGRDPDVKHSQMVFYVILKEGKWKLSGYRQNRPLGRGDAELIRLLKNWLASGGVPSGDFVD